LVNKTSRLHFELLNNVVVELMNFELKIANNSVLIQLLKESVSDRLLTRVLINLLFKHLAVAVHPPAELLS